MKYVVVLQKNLYLWLLKFFFLLTSRHLAIEESEFDFLAFTSCGYVIITYRVVIFYAVFISRGSVSIYINIGES